MPIHRANAEQRVAIVGAGIAGLSCAAELDAAGYHVTLFDKGRGPGGRMSSRRFSTPLGEAVADHGAQYFTARDPAFLTQVQEWENAGVVAPWPDISDDTWVGVPTMNQIVRHMAVGLSVHWNMRVTSASRTQIGWTLQTQDAEIEGAFDILVLAIPSEQAVTILAQHDFAMAREAMLARFQPCWTAIFAFDMPLATDITHLRDRDVIGWASRETTKPGRAGVETWVVQASASWSADCLEDPAEDIAQTLLNALAQELQLPPLHPIGYSTHRWRFAMSTGLGTGSLWNNHLHLGVCGDWLLGPRIECGWLSGRHLSARILVEELVAAAE